MASVTTSLAALVAALCLLGCGVRAQDGGNLTFVVVDRTGCNWKDGDYGQITVCNSNEIMVGSCGSGRDPDCDGRSYDQLLCCPVEAYLYDTGSCQDFYGSYGEQLSCPAETNGGDAVLSNFIVQGICGSGRDDDCIAPDDSRHNHMIRCCQSEILGDDGGDIYSAGNCYWLFEDYGKPVECVKDNESVFGRCGSGRDPDCEGDHYHGIQCCTLIHP